MGMNYIAAGRSIEIAIPGGGCQSGGQVSPNSTIGTPGLCIQVGNDMVGIPEGSYSAGAVGNVTLHLSGAFGNMLLHTGDTPAVGDKLYWDNTDGYLTTTSGGNVLAGHCYELPAVVNGNTVVGILLKNF